MTPTLSLRRGTLLVGAFAAATVAWLAAFPPEPRLDWVDVARGSAYTLAVFAGYVFLPRRHDRVLELGWVVFLFSLLLEVVDEFTTEPEFWGDDVTSALGLAGLLMVGIGFYRSAALQEREEAEGERARQDLLRAKEEAETANAALTEALRAKDEVVSIVAHDFRSPLTVVQGYAEALASRLSDPRDRTMAEAIVVQSRRLAALAADTLTMSRADAGTLSMTREPVDLTGLVHGVVDARRAAGGPAVALETGPAAWVEGDPGRLQQLFENLVDNAIKYGGGADVRVRFAPELGGVRVTVEDGGPGIPPAEMPLLFRKFSRLPAARRTAVVGTGLGLFICRSIVEAHGGRIWAESPPAGGTAFHVLLPTRPAAG